MGRKQQETRGQVLLDAWRIFPSGIIKPSHSLESDQPLFL